jgi:hypothetical protein
VECCEQKAACCFDQMCCLPRYAKAAGVQPKPFTPEVPVYSSAQSLEPLPGETVKKSSWYDRYNPFKGDEGNRSTPSPTPQTAAKESTEDEDDGFWGRLWPF